MLSIDGAFPNTQSFRSRRRILAIGAGLAGLAAARALADRHYEVVVLEGRDRIGGRCHTVDGIDLGAHWIHGTEGNPLTALARQLEVETLFVGGDSTLTGGWDHLMVVDSGARPVTADGKLASILMADDLWDRLDDLRRRHLQQGQPDISMRKAIQEVMLAKGLTAEEQTIFNWHAALLVRDDCATEPDHLSFQWWDEGFEVYGYGDSIFMGGYAALVEELGRDLDIRLEHRVEKISTSTDPAALVRVETDQGTFYGDTVVITLPLGVLKKGDVNFDPPLPDTKQRAIERLGMGNLTKVIVHFDAPFWPRDQYCFGYRSRNVRNHPTILINLWKTHRIPTLVMLIGGDKGREIETWTASALESWTLGVLQDVFGADRIRPPKSLTCTQWANDPFAQGAYSYIALGSTPDDIDALAEPLYDKLFFAGEATNRYHWAVAHGAYASGLREAARISGDPTILPVRHFTENRRWRNMTMRTTRFFNTLTATMSPPEIETRLSVLRDSEVFARVPANEVRMLASMMEIQPYETGQIICRVGDSATNVYVIADGEVEVRLADGLAVTTLKRGSVVGEYGLFGGQVRTATLVACSPSRLLALDYQRFQRFLLAFPESALALLGVTIHRLLEEVNARRGSTSSIARTVL